MWCLPWQVYVEQARSLSSQALMVTSLLLSLLREAAVKRTVLFQLDGHFNFCLPAPASSEEGMLQSLCAIW